MKAQTIAQQLRSTLPRYTDLFSDILNIESLTYSGGIVTASTGLIPHGLVNGAQIYIYGALTPISITSLTQTNGIATGITSSPHDFTDNYTENVNIFGADQQEYNGEHKFIHQPNRLTFQFEVDKNAISPATGSNIYLLENIKTGYNGSHIITVIDDFTFTYNITSNPESPAQGNIKLSSPTRISCGISIDQLIASYTPQAYPNQENKLCAFVVMGACSTSKNREILTDNTTLIASGQDIRDRIIEQFSIYIFAPCENEVSGAIVRDLMSDLMQPILKSIMRFTSPSGFADATNFGIIFAGHDFYSYQHAYYIHQFLFEYTYDLTYTDTIDTDNSVAFRDIELNFLNKYKTLVMHTNVNLDDEPIT